MSNFDEQLEQAIKESMITAQRETKQHRKNLLGHLPSFGNIAVETGVRSKRSDTSGDEALALALSDGFDHLPSFGNIAVETGVRSKGKPDTSGDEALARVLSDGFVRQAYDAPPHPFEDDDMQMALAMSMVPNKRETPIDDKIQRLRSRKTELERRLEIIKCKYPRDKRESLLDGKVEAEIRLELFDLDEKLDMIHKLVRELSDDDDSTIDY